MPHKQKIRDLLDEPIVRPDPLIVGLVAHRYRHSPAAQAAIHKKAVDVVVQQKLAKLKLLAERHGVDLGAPHAWCELCLRLAEHYVEGFKVLYPYAYSDMPEMEVSPRGPGGPRKDQRDLVDAIQARVRDKREKVIEACRKLSRDPKGRWHGLPPKSLQSRYCEWQQQYKRTDPLVEMLCRAADRAVLGDRS
jgi:hypothetical protein